ncbi:MAG: glycosyltransferase family 1 protein [Thermoanaerobaculaceae bacterium]|nr:glycosyltransferase family 1 protein [Thermoanaerobaculaceae bacterium]
MRVGVDGKPLLAARAGVARYLDGLLGGLADLATPAAEFDVISPARPRGTLRWVMWDLQRATGRGYDAFHFPFYYPPLAPRCPVTVTVHDVLPLEHPEWFPHGKANPLRLLIPAGARRAAAVLVSSVAVAEAVSERCRVPMARIHVTGFGVDHARFAPPSEDAVAAALAQLGIARPYLLQVGALEPRRGTDLALAACASLRERHPGLRLVLAGDVRADVPSLRQPPPWVRRLGRVADDALPALYAGAAAVLAPSRGEGFDFPVLEALACGGAVVASDIAVHREHFAPAVALFASGDAEALAGALTRVVEDTEACRALRAAGPALAARFSWAEAARRHLEAWRALGGR